jgi:hypothetical protein
MAGYRQKSGCFDETRKAGLSVAYRAEMSA